MQPPGELLGYLYDDDVCRYSVDARLVPLDMVCCVLCLDRLMAAYLVVEILDCVETAQGIALGIALNTVLGTVLHIGLDMSFDLAVVDMPVAAVDLVPFRS
jgi:hypothetical protein